MKHFEDFYPSVVFMYILFALVPVMFLADLWISLVAVIAGLGYLCILKKSFPGKIIFGGLVIVLVMAIANGIFVHEGERELFFINDRAVTLESIMYGAKSGVMFFGGIVWFIIFSHIMTGEKITAVFRHLPKLGLMLSMVLRLTERIVKRYSEVSKCGAVNENMAGDNKEHAMKKMSAVMTWVIESGAEMADTMTKRGYKSRRKKYIIYNLRQRDAVLIILMLSGGAGFFLKGAGGLIAMCAYYFLPIFYEIKECIKWHFYSLKK